jgi:broad specificity phosphatase PhoE
MTTFLLIRHAAHGWLGRGLAGRLKGVQLSPEGREEARALAANLSDFPVQAIYSSPLDRARETAAFLAAEFHLNVVYDAAFLEIDFGRWTGLAVATLEQDPEWLRWNTHRETARVPGGEAMSEVRQRAIDQLDQLARRHDAGCIIIVSHADIIRAILTYCLGWSLDQIHDLEIQPASVTIVEWRDKCGRVVVINHPGARSKISPSQFPAPSPPR